MIFSMSGLPVFFVSIRLAARARYVGLAFFSIVFLILSAVLSSGFSGRQSSTVALDVGISVIRLMLPFVVILLSQELIFREFERRYSLSSLSYPRARISFLLDRFFAIVFLVFMLLIVMALVLKGVVHFVEREYGQVSRVDMGWPYFLVVSFVALDALILVALACFLGVTASASGFILIGTLGFMVVSRSYASIVGLLAQDGGVVSNTEVYGATLSLLNYLIPDLGSLDVRMVALYGRMDFFPVEWIWLLLSSAGYVVFLVLLALWAINRKRIS